jgi:hypothetical protein
VGDYFVNKISAAQLRSSLILDPCQVLLRQDIDPALECADPDLERLAIFTILPSINIADNAKHRGLYLIIPFSQVRDEPRKEEPPICAGSISVTDPRTFYGRDSAQVVGVTPC